MNIAFFSTKAYDRRFFTAANAAAQHAITFLEPRLTVATAPLARGHEAVCAFVNDQLSRAVLTQLKNDGTRLIALRSAGYNHVDLAAARELGVTVVNVPHYSPHAVAEHTVAAVIVEVPAYAGALRGEMGLNISGAVEMALLGFLKLASRPGHSDPGTPLGPAPHLSRRR